MKIKQFLSEQVQQAMIAAGILEQHGPHVALSNRPQFGEYQANGILGAAKQLKTNPRELATKVVEALDLSAVAEKVEIAGPGFINIFLKNDWLAKQMQKLNADDRLGVTQAQTS